MVASDQYMQTMEKELTEVRQSVVKIETAMQKFLNQSSEAVRNARNKDGTDKKDTRNEKSANDLATTLKKLKEEGDKIGETLNKAAGNAFSKAGDALVNYLKTGKMDWSDVVKTLKTDFKNIAVKEAGALVAGGLMKWLGIEDGKTGKIPASGAAEANAATQPENGLKSDTLKNFFDGLTQSFAEFFANGKALIVNVFDFLKTVPGIGGLVGDVGKAASGVGGLFSGLGKSIGRFLGMNGLPGSDGNDTTGETGAGMGRNTAEGMQQVAEAGKQSANEMAAAMQGAMKRTESALTRFVETGKLSFKDLTKSILADIAQIMIKMAVSKLVSFVGGSLFGGLGGAAGATASAAGGYDIPSGENPLTQLHEKEMVLPAQYADVIRGLAGNGGTGASGGININTSISVSGDGMADQRNEGGTSAQRRLADMINQQTKAVIAREMRQGGLIWNMRMGVA